MTQVLPSTTEAMTEPLVSIVYSSFSTTPFSDADLAALLAQSRLNNEPRGITGMLLHRDGQFMQALEGPRAAVHSLLRVIAGDLRHTGMWTLDEAPLARRRFGSWSMGYRDLAQVDAADLPGWYGSPEALDHGADALPADRAGELLHWFRDR